MRAGKTINFSLSDVGEQSFVVTRKEEGQPSASVTFSVGDGLIIIKGDNVSFAAKLSMPIGNDEELVEPWQVRRQALESLFSPVTGK